MVWRVGVTLENTIFLDRIEGVHYGWLTRQLLDDIKEWTGLSFNEMWREPEDSVAWRKYDSHFAQGTE